MITNARAFSALFQILLIAGTSAVLAYTISLIARLRAQRHIKEKRKPIVAVWMGLYALAGSLIGMIFILTAPLIFLVTGIDINGVVFRTTIEKSQFLLIVCVTIQRFLGLYGVLMLLYSFRHIYTLPSNMDSTLNAQRRKMVQK